MQELSYFVNEVGGWVAAYEVAGDALGGGQHLFAQVLAKAYCMLVVVGAEVVEGLLRIQLVFIRVVDGLAQVIDQVGVQRLKSAQVVFGERRLPPLGNQLVQLVILLIGEAAVLAGDGIEQVPDGFINVLEIYFHGWGG